MGHQVNSTFISPTTLIIKWFLSSKLKNPRSFPTLIRGDGGTSSSLGVPTTFVWDSRFTVRPTCCYNGISTAPNHNNGSRQQQKHYFCSTFPVSSFEFLNNVKWGIFQKRIRNFIVRLIGYVLMVGKFRKEKKRNELVCMKNVAFNYVYKRI